MTIDDVGPIDYRYDMSGKLATIWDDFIQGAEVAISTWLSPGDAPASIAPPRYNMMDTNRDGELQRMHLAATLRTYRIAGVRIALNN